MSEKLSEDRFDPGSLLFIEQMYEQFLEDPDSLSDTWRNYFAGWENGSGTGANGDYVSHASVQSELIRQARRSRAPGRGPSAAPAARPAAPVRRPGGSADQQSAVTRLIQAYRLLGHARADFYPLRFTESQKVEDLDPAFHGLGEDDLDTVFETGMLAGPDERPLHEILDVLAKTYTGHVGAEFMHITNRDQKKWVQERLESHFSREGAAFPVDKRLHIMRRITAAEGLERYLHIRFSGQKRFGLEGGESLIPLLDELIWQSGSVGVKEVVLGMAHRGRLNVLVNIMGKQPRELVEQFEGKLDHIPDDKMTGDVKYHQGFSSDVLTPGGPVHLAMAFNPSHLEIINPVVEGSARARQDRRNDTGRSTIQPVLIHGDAAVAGQGVVCETINLSGTRGYNTGGTIHIVVNNQIGFTTSNPLDTRSSLYCTDVGYIIQAPILHVNADDPEAVVFAAQFAVDFRAAFHKDVFIDLCCYRRHGHNESDEPSATQPLMYENIRTHPSVLKMYSDRLIDEGVITRDHVKNMVRDYRDALDEGDRVSYNPASAKDYTYLTHWNPYLNGRWDEKVETAVPVKRLKQLGRKAVSVPEGFTLHPGVAKIMSDRAEMIEGKLPMDWGCAEILAYATLLKDGYSVRFSGQDSCRGTFFHRHAVVHDQRDGAKHCSLETLFENQPRFQVIDSILSEEAVLGFEYGYSTTEPNSLVVWEAQYGDFANGAQVVVDQFISSSQQKWNLFSGLAMMLPHGWEGQGPEHSSARLERYLQLCAQENMQVVVPSSPAQMFHLLRRQMLRKIRIPLIIMSPKSMLRRKESFTGIEDLTEGKFQLVIGERSREVKKKDVRRVVICSGKIYYELFKRRQEEGLTNVALVRLEQIYPFPEKEMRAELNKYPAATEIIWAQEEPRNQGAWYQIQHRIIQLVKEGQVLEYAGRIPCSAPAGGSYQRHMERETKLIEEALGISNKPGKTKPA